MSSVSERRADASPAEQVIQDAIAAYCDDLLKLADPRHASFSLPSAIAGALRSADMLAEFTLAEGTCGHLIVVEPVLRCRECRTPLIVARACQECGQPQLMRCPQCHSLAGGDPDV